MAIENVKYIDASLEGSILKYNLDEPLIAGNVNVYQFRISLANIAEAQNSFWNFLIKNDGLFEVNFRSLKTSEIGGEGTVVTLEKDSKENPQYLYCEVPDGSNGGNELYGGYRLEIEVRGSTTVDGKTYKYCTKTMPNPPMVYSSGSFKTSIDLSEETYLRAFMNKFTGGKPGQIMVKRSDSDYDVDWKKSLPNQLIFGGHGTFTETGDYEVVLTPAAQEILIEREKLELNDPQSMAEPADNYPAFEEEVSLRKVIIDFSKPEYYTGLEFLSTNHGSYTFEGVQTEMNTGDKITSNGFSWGLIKASAIGMQGTSFSTTTIDKGIYKSLPSYEIELNNSKGAINIPSLLPNGDLANLRQLSNYAGKIQEIVDTSADIVDKWRKLGTCFFKVQGDSGASGYITAPVDHGGNGFVENYVIKGSDELVFQRWISNTGKRFYRSSASVYGKWPEWTQEFDYGQVLSIENGGTNATTIAGARTNLEVYSQTEVNNKLAERASLTQTSPQIFQGHVSGISLTSRETPNDNAVFINLDKADGGPAAKFWKSLVSGNTYLTTYPLEATDITDRINYIFTAPKKGDGAIDRQVYHTGNLIYRTDQVPTFDKDIYPAGTICLVKVNG